MWTQPYEIVSVTLPNVYAVNMLIDAVIQTQSGICFSSLLAAVKS